MASGILRKLLNFKRRLALVIFIVGFVSRELIVHDIVTAFFGNQNFRKSVLMDPFDDIVLSEQRQTDLHKLVEGLNITKIMPPISLDIIVKRTGNSSPFVQPDEIVATTRVLEPCPAEPRDLRGRLQVNVDVIPAMGETAKENPDVRVGGRWRPLQCTSRHKVAIIIPFRDRQAHLQLLLSHVHPILQRQQLDYGVYVVEQYGSGAFNRATLMNIAFVYALSEEDYRCFVFHDVDLLSEDDRNLYTCADQPKHLSVAVDKLGYRLPYADIFGGVVALSADQFRRVNGFSNMYWGWGSEDDDMSRRVRMNGLKILRPSVDIGRYKMIPHKKLPKSPDKDRVYNSIANNSNTDGLNSLEYELVAEYKKQLYTHLVAKLKEPSSMNVP